MDDLFPLDPNGFNLGEYALMEEISGLDIDELVTAMEGSRSARFLLALTMVSGCRLDPAFTLEDAAATSLHDAGVVVADA